MIINQPLNEHAFQEHVIIEHTLHQNSSIKQAHKIEHNIRSRNFFKQMKMETCLAFQKSNTKIKLEIMMT